MKRKIDIHPTKLFAYIYPLFAKEFMFSEKYEDFASEVNKYFDLTPAQWESLLREWELRK